MITVNQNQEKTSYNNVNGSRNISGADSPDMKVMPAFYLVIIA